MLVVPLCHMVPILIVCPALNSDITKLEVDFFNGYYDGDHVFYMSATNSKGDFQFVNDEVRASWSPNWTQTSHLFEFQLDSNPSFTSYKNKMIFA